jgi:hypothetical protein
MAVSMSLQSYYSLGLDADFGALLINTGINFNVWDFGSWVAWQKVTIAATYVSTLIQSVDFKQNTFKTKEVKLGAFSFTLPQYVDLGGFSITFQEDDLSSVKRFYDDWLESLMDEGGMFNNLKSYSLSFIFARTTGLKIPTYTEMFPRVYPVSIKESTASYDSDDLKTYTIEFVRIPNMNRGILEGIIGALY